MNAHLRFRLGEIVFRPAVLLMDRVVRLDGHVGKLIAALRNPVPDREIVSCVREQRQQNQTGGDTKKYGFQPFSNLVGSI
jgi:hypothetical protein